jgi:cell division protein FtsZ
VTVDGARGVLFNVVGGPDLTLFEVNEAAEVIKGAVDPDANIIFGVASENSMGSDVRITLIATGFTTNNGLEAKEDDEMTRQLKSIKTEDELDLPSFLRRAKPMFSRQAVPQKVETKITRPPSRSFNP